MLLRGLVLVVLLRAGRGRVPQAETYESTLLGIERRLRSSTPLRGLQTHRELALTLVLRGVWRFHTVPTPDNTQMCGWKDR